MKIIRVITALVLAVGLLYLASISSEGRPRFVSHSENGFTFEMTTVPKALEDSTARITITVKGDMQPDLRLYFRPSKSTQDADTELRHYSQVPMVLEDSAAGHYYAVANAGARGGRMYYYFEIRDNTGGLRAGFRQPDGSPFVLKYIGHVPGSIIAGHVAMMLLTVVFLMMGFLYAVTVVRKNTDTRPMAVYFSLATLCAFLGCYPLGMAMNYYAFGTTWEGVPFGTDATDNKTQLLFAYLLYLVLVGIGSLTGNKLERNIYSERVLGWLGVGALPLVLFIYLIPHSIQFSPALTYAVCYSFIGLLALLYAVGLVRQQLTVRRSGVRSPRTQ
ncbi:MAG: hypothetical protein ABII79_00670 [bacterium]